MALLLDEDKENENFEEYEIRMKVE